MEIQKIIASNIKALRSSKGLTLDEAAKITGVSRSMLAQIEKGDVNPTISVLWKIAVGFKVSFSSLMENRETESYVVRKKDIVPFVESDGKYINYPIFSFQEDKLFETYRIHIKVGVFLQAQPHLTGTEEYITVFSGQVEITSGDDSFSLGEGDSLRFKADLPHSYRNTGECDAFLSMIIYYSQNK